jgi:hypothetical protein
MRRLVGTTQPRSGPKGALLGAASEQLPFGGFPEQSKETVIAMSAQYTIGLDYGTNSVRALLAEAAADQEAGTVSRGGFLLFGVLNPRARIMRGQHYV